MEKTKFLILFDLPFNQCDKIWLFYELKNFGEVSVVECKYNLWKTSQILPRYKIGIMISLFLVVVQALYSLIKSDNDTIIVTWSNIQGLIINLLSRIFFIKRHIISFCWIGKPSKIIYPLAKFALKNTNFMPIVNRVSLRNELIKQFSLIKWNGMFLPDTYDSNDVFLPPRYGKKNKYCFAGGTNNRDWNIIVIVAQMLPHIQFKIVGDKYASNITKLNNLSNVEVFHNINPEQYYELMRNAYVSICPLKEDKVSGLINIIKSHQYGIPCISTEFDFSSMYYPDDLKCLLFRPGEADSLAHIINYMFVLDKQQYNDIVVIAQRYLMENFASHNLVSRLINQLKIKKWI